jgi:hypothetical protein
MAAQPSIFPPVWPGTKPLLEKEPNQMSNEDRIITDRREDGRAADQPRQGGYDQREGYEDSRTRMVGDPERIDVDPGVDRRSRTERKESASWSLEMPKAFAVSEDRVHWGPIWAGLFTATTAMILLGLLGVAIGLTVSDDPAWARGDVRTNTTGAAIWGAISGIISFFVGGWAAAKMSAIFSRGWGAWNGALVFMLSLPLTLLLASSGLGSLLGAVGQLAPAFNVNPGSFSNAAQDLSMRSIRSALAGTAWWSLIGSIVALAAAAVGGAIGTRRRIPLDRLEGSVRRDPRREPA